MTPSRQSLDLVTLPERFAIARLAPDTEIPGWARADASLVCIARTRDELSIVAPEDRIPPAVRASRGWCALRARGVLEFELVGVLASLAAPLSDAGVSVFAVSTFDTDYLLVKTTKAVRATEALTAAGHHVVPAAA